MNAILYNLSRNPWFWGAIAWLLLGIAWGEKRKAILKRLGDIFSKSIIFIEDLEPSVPLYPRSFLEQVANGFKNAMSRPLTTIINAFNKFIQSQHRIIYDYDKPLRTFAYIFFLLSLAAFFYADSIAIANGLSTLGLIVAELPEYLLRYDIAVGVSTFLAIIIGFVVFSETLSESTELTHWDEAGGTWKGVARSISLIIILMGILIAALLGVSRLIALGYVEAQQGIEFSVQFGINVLTLLNGLLAAALVFSEGFRGFVIIFVAIEWVISGVLSIANYIVSIVGFILPFFTDIIWRVIYVILDILFYVLFVPFLGILAFFENFFGRFK